MKRFIALRKLKRKCRHCNSKILKGNIYYKEREVYKSEWDKIYTYEYIVCPKCKYKIKQHEKRFAEFQNICIHPIKFIETEWSYIPGECIKEPNYDYCRLCGKILY